MFYASELIEDARDLLSDSVEPFRWEEATLLDWLGDGMSQLFSSRPDLFYEDSILVTCPERPAAVSDQVQVSPEGKPVLVNYIVYRSLLRDNEDSETFQQAARFLELYKMGI